ncbi:MAG: hypothetical protein IJD96_04260 [Lachnospiraceae bacterium]|nr:hypothetical protein [Lachnospiraceae bacterium]
MSKKNLKKLLVATMAMVMLFGNSLSVLATNYNYNDLTVGQELTGGDTVTFTGYSGAPRVYYDDTLWEAANVGGGININFVTDVMTISNGYIYYVKHKEVLSGSSPTPRLDLSTTPIAPTTPSTKPGKSEHHHNFQWKIVKDPTLREDGLAQSVCECGAVEAQQPVSSGTAFINMVRDKIEAAPQGGTVEISSELYFCYTAKIMKALQARPDVSLKTNYLTEDGTWHTFTIPAGSAPAGDTQFYGFTGLANYYNGGSGDCDHVHDEVCGGEENCEHVHDEDCDIEEDCEHIHDEACGYVEGTDAGCTHVHNEDC